MRTRCKFRVVGVEDTEYQISKLVSVVPANEPDPADGSVSHYERKKFEPYDPPKYAQNVRLAASYDASNPEDVSFSDSTPSGELKIYVCNPVVVGTFRPGKNYFLDLIPCE